MCKKFITLLCTVLSLLTVLMFTSCADLNTYSFVNGQAFVCTSYEIDYSKSKEAQVEFVESIAKQNIEKGLDKVIFEGNNNISCTISWIPKWSKWSVVGNKITVGQDDGEFKLFGKYDVVFTKNGENLDFWDPYTFELMGVSITYKFEKYKEI